MSEEIKNLTEEGIEEVTEGIKEETLEENRQDEGSSWPEEEGQVEAEEAEKDTKVRTDETENGEQEASSVVNAREFIEFESVRKTYIMGETQIHALEGVDFKIKKGELVVVVGASGAGKSTILNILGGMDTLTDGKIFVDGQEISSYNDRQMTLYRRYDVGFVFQFYNLVQNLTAKENVELATQVSKNPLDVDETMKAVGLEDRMANFPSQLSGGEQQRVAIARALAKNPKLLLCDEPTGALDYTTGKSILQLLQNTAKSSGMTVIIITHNFALTNIGDRVITVRSGRIESVTINENPKEIRDIEW